MTVQFDEPRPGAAISPGKLIAGLTLAAVGLLLTADNFDYLEAETYFRWWPVALIVFGAIKLGEPGSRDVAAVLLVAGGWILAFNLGLIHFTIFDLWPLILIAIGLGFVRKSLRGDAPEPGPSSMDALRGRENLALLTTRRVRPGAVFSGGRFLAILGTYQLDLTGSTLEQDPTVIEARAFLGGIEIYVPEGWDVAGEVFPVMAGFEMKTGPATEPRKRLVVRGFALMAGIEVKHIERIGS